MNRETDFINEAPNSTLTNRVEATLVPAGVISIVTKKYRVQFTLDIRLLGFSLHVLQLLL